MQKEALRDEKQNQLDEISPTVMHCIHCFKPGVKIVVGSALSACLTRFHQALGWSSCFVLSFFCWEAAWVCPGRSALQSAAQGETKTLRPFCHSDVIVKTKKHETNLQKRATRPESIYKYSKEWFHRHRKKRALVKTRRWAPVPEREYTEEGFGEIREESTCAGASVPCRWEEECSKSSG